MCFNRSSVYGRSPSLRSYSRRTWRKKDDAADKAWKAAVELCDGEAAKVDKPLREIWSATCRSLARNLNFELLWKGDENGKQSFDFPVQVSDDIISRTRDGSKVKQLDPLMLTQHNLRWAGWRSCLSEPTTMKKILEAQSLSFSEAVDLIAKNIKGLGGRETDVRQISGELKPQEQVDAAVAYLEARLDGRISSTAIDPDQLSAGDLRAVQVLDTSLAKIFHWNYYYRNPTPSDLDVLAEFFVLSAAHGEELLALAKIYLPHIDSGKPVPAEAWEAERVWKTLYDRMNKLVGMSSSPFLLKDFVQGFHDAAEQAKAKQAK